MVLNFKNVDTSDWSKSWNRSKQPRKQRKYIINAPKHVRRKLIVARLSKEIQEVAGIKRLPVVVGDTVVIERGKFRGKEGKVVYVDTKYYRVYVDVAKIEKANGETAYYPIHPSKLVITKLNLTDKRRLEIIKRKNENLGEDNINKLMNMSITNKDDLKDVYEIAKSFK